MLFAELSVLCLRARLPCRLALDWGLLACSGKTPEATMASAMYGDIKRKDRHSLFIRQVLGATGGAHIGQRACLLRALVCTPPVEGAVGMQQGKATSLWPLLSPLPAWLQATGGYVWAAGVG